MKKFSEKGRKVLRRILMLLGATTISVLFTACYGMPMDDYCDDCHMNTWGGCKCGEEISGDN